MKRIFSLFIGALCVAYACAGVTTYRFTSVNWASEVGADKCDGKTDGWVCDAPASAYDKGRVWADGLLHSAGASVQTAQSGAGATSVKSFTNVRRLVVNFCQNSSKGQGVIYVQVGEAAPDSIVVHKPASGTGELNRDSSIVLATPVSGKIRFWVRVKENAIHINSISIRAEEGGSNPFTTSTFQLVTNVDQLQDSDQIIIGVFKADVDKIMGYFDEMVSRNNIHAIPGRYSGDRTTVSANNDAIYTLRTGKTSKGADAWYIQDELRYELAYLVASGGQTKNRLALWDKLTDKTTYGDYGYWDIHVEDNGEATIMNLGNSLGKYLQYNASNNPTLFGCYASLSQTPVCIYREVPAIGNVDTILVPLVNFGELALKEGSVSVNRTVEVQANLLKEDISISLKQGTAFRVETTTMDRDGDYLSIHFVADQPGRYVDTLVLVSGDCRTEAPLMATVRPTLTIAEAVMEPDFAMVFLSDVVVTKKFDSYIFIRDNTGSMMIYDGGDGTGHRYGSGLKNGDVLSGVQGRFRNYFGVPEIFPSAAWNTQTGEPCLPETVMAVDSADVCRFVRIENAEVVDGSLTVGESTIPVVDAFNTGITEQEITTLDAIVYISHDELQLWVVTQQTNTAINDVNADSATGIKYMRNGELYIQYLDHIYNVLGTGF